ncbi:MAG: kdpD 3, partial [Sporomusa sp.]|nr:kdpD 3 [Sporomusa sp.]
VKLAETARQATLLAESDKLRTALFNSISHELRTPLATITGAVSTLLDTGVEYSKAIRCELLETVQEGASRMERVVSNLLDTARLESGMLRLKTDWCDIEDIVGTALRRMGDIPRKYLIKTTLADDLPLIRADCVLLEQVLVNFIDNAVKYSATGSTITIAAWQQGNRVKVSVADHGPGIPEADVTRIFEKFYRASQTGRVSGTGLGLSICKSIIEAHGGQIWAGNHPEGGAIVSFSLPIRGDGAVIPAKAGEL